MQLYSKRYMPIFLILFVIATISPVKANYFDTHTQIFYLSGVLATGAAISMAVPPKIPKGYRILKAILGVLTLQRAFVNTIKMNGRNSLFVTKCFLLFTIAKSYIGISLLLNSIFGDQEKQKEKDAQKMLQKNIDHICCSIKNIIQQKELPKEII